MAEPKGYDWRRALLAALFWYSFHYGLLFLARIYPWRFGRDLFESAVELSFISVIPLMGAYFYFRLRDADWILGVLLAITFAATYLVFALIVTVMHPFNYGVAVGADLPYVLLMIPMFAAFGAYLSWFRRN